MTVLPKKRYDSKAMKKLFKWLLVLLVALTLAVVVVLYNPHFFKGTLERYLSDAVGYSVSLNGEIEIDTGRLIKVTARRVHISGPDWAAEEDLIAVGHLSIVVNTASLFKDTILVQSVVVDELRFNLETNQEGKGNWITANQPPQAPKEKADRVLVVFNNVQVRDASIRFHNGKTGVETIFDIDSLDHQQQADGMLHTILNGDLNNRLVEYTHTIGPYTNLLDGRDISYQATGSIGELELKGSAYVDDFRAPKSPSFKFDIQGPNIDEITAMLGIDDLGTGGFSLRTNGTLVNNRYEAEVNGQVGDISLNASAQTSDIETFRELDMRVAVNGPNLGAFTRIFGVEHWPDKPFSLKGRAERLGQTLNVRDLTLNVGGTKLLLDALLTEFPTLESSRIKLMISGDEVEQFHELLGYEGLATGPFNINGSLDVSPDGVELLEIALDTTLGSALVSGTLGDAPSYAGSKFNVHLDGSNANAVLAGFGIDVLPEKSFNLNTRLEVVDNGLLVERGVLVTQEDERLELDGLIAFSAGIQGTDLDVKLNGKHFADVIRRHVGDIELPDSPYDLNGNIKIEEKAIRFEKLLFEYEGINLETSGLLKLDDQLSGTALDFQIGGKNLSDLRKFQAIGDSLDILVPGQPYELAGRFVIEKNRFRVNDINGVIGQTKLAFDATINKQTDWIGSGFRFSINGPDINRLLVLRGETDLPGGEFKSSAQVLLSDKILSSDNFGFETGSARGEVDLELDWPFSSRGNIDFDLLLEGDDIRNFLPPLGPYKAEMAAFKINTKGNKRGDLLTFDQFESNIGNLIISLTGQVDENPGDNQMTVTFNVHSDDVSILGRLNGKPLPALPLDINAVFKGNVREFVVPTLVSSFGQSRMEGELEVSLEGSRPDIKLTANSDYIDMRPFLDPKQEEPEDNGSDSPKPDRLIPATPLPLDLLAAYDLRIKLNIGELQYLQDSITDLVVNLEQRSGKLDISQLSYEAPRGKLWSSLSISPTQANKADVKIGLRTDELAFNVSGVSDEQLPELPAFDVLLQAEGNGSNLREVTGSLNGSIYIASKGGNAENVDLSILETFILDEIFSALMPKAKDSLGTELTCIAANLDITDGLVTTTPAFAISTPKIAIITRGTLDLKTEEMKFNFNSTPTQALKISASEMFHPYILIGGTLANPSVGVDPSKAALHGGAAIATLGLSVLAKGVVDRAGNVNPLCIEMLNNPPES